MSIEHEYIANKKQAERSLARDERVNEFIDRFKAAVWSHYNAGGKSFSLSVMTAFEAAMREPDSAGENTLRNSGFLFLPHISSDDDFTEIITRCDQLLKSKGADYTQGASNTKGSRFKRLLNFFKTGEKRGISPFTALAVYKGKHQDAIDTFLQKGQVESEPIKERLVDDINYTLLLHKLNKYVQELKDAGLAVTNDNIGHMAQRYEAMRDVPSEEEATKAP